MTESEQQTAFAHDVDAVIRRYRNEFDLTVAGAVGVLELLKAELINEALEDDPEDDE